MSPVLLNWSASRVAALLLLVLKHRLDLRLSAAWKPCHHDDGNKHQQAHYNLDLVFHRVSSPSVCDSAWRASPINVLIAATA